MRLDNVKKIKVTGSISSKIYSLQRLQVRQRGFIWPEMKMNFTTFRAQVGGPCYSCSRYLFIPYSFFTRIGIETLKHDSMYN